MATGSRFDSETHAALLSWLGLIARSTGGLASGVAKDLVALPELPRLFLQFRMARVLKAIDEGDKSGISLLCGYLRDRGLNWRDRAFAAFLLGAISGDAQVIACLTEVAESPREDVTLRFVAMMSLGKIGAPAGLEALRKILCSRESERADNVRFGPEEHDLQSWAAAFLSESPGGRAILRRIGRQPGAYTRPWRIVVLNGFAGDSEEIIRDVLLSSRHMVDARVAALEVLIEILTDKYPGHFSGWHRDAWWEQVVSLSLASSEPAPLRRRADEAVKRYRLGRGPVSVGRRM